MEQIFINNKSYSLTSFAQQFDLSYTTVYRYYKKGYRNRLLLKAVKKVSHSAVVVNGIHFSSKHQAAAHFKIPKTTFYNWLKQDNIDLGKKIEDYHKTAKCA